MSPVKQERNSVNIDEMSNLEMSIPPLVEAESMEIETTERSKKPQSSCDSRMRNLWDLEDMIK
jgi:hypothetical protein